MCVLDYCKESHPSLPQSQYGTGSHNQLVDPKGKKILGTELVFYSPAAASIQNIILLVIILKDVNFISINKIISSLIVIDRYTVSGLIFLMPFKL